MHECLEYEGVSLLARCAHARKDVQTEHGMNVRTQAPARVDLKEVSLSTHLNKNVSVELKGVWELLVTLLDGLHKHPNRVIKKPDVEEPDITRKMLSEGKREEKLAAEAGPDTLLLFLL